jgi:hypothetical protein
VPKNFLPSDLLEKSKRAGSEITIKSNQPDNETKANQANLPAK